MPERRRRSALSEMRREVQPRVLRPAPELVVDPTLPGDNVNDGAFCPVKKRITGKSICNYVECGTCDFLRAELEERSPDYTWVCFACVTGLRALPYWSDGPCDACGEQSIVRTLAVPR